MTTRAVVFGTVSLAAAARAASAFVAVRPLAGSLSRLLGEGTDDVVLYEPGGVRLLDVVDAATRETGWRASMAVSTLFGSLVIGSAALITLIAVRGTLAEPLRVVLPKVVLARLGRMTLLAAAELVARAFAVGFASALVGFAARPFVGVASVRAPFIGGAFAGAAVALAIGVLIDLARSKVVWFDAGLGEALRDAGAWLKGDWLRLLGGAAFRVAAVALVMLIGSALTLALAPTHPKFSLSLALGVGFAGACARSFWFRWLATLEQKRASSRT